MCAGSEEHAANDDAGNGSVTGASGEAGQQELDPDEEGSDTNSDDDSDTGSVGEDATIDVMKFSLE